MKSGLVPAALVVELRRTFGDQVQEAESLAPHTSARIGGPADILLTVRSAHELTEAAQLLWSHELPFRVLGGGSNILVADAGFRGVVVLNKAKKVVFQEEHEPTIWSESGASLGGVARRAVSKGWRGLEWATTIPGTIGGAVVGNAGAHGMDLASCLEMAEILQRDKGPERWPVERLDYSYRSSWLKTNPGKAVVLSAVFRMEKGSPTEAKKRMEQFIRYRQDTQPSGANWGSMFKNPPGDAAGRLIEAAELKGLQIGDARVSRKHANFFLNVGEASAHDVLRLIAAVQTEVKRRFGVALELEIELMGEWQSSLYER